MTTQRKSSFFWLWRRWCWRCCCCCHFSVQILFWKKRAEEELQRSGLSYTIVRPGRARQQNSSSSNNTVRSMLFMPGRR
jgi:hypothetical protein